MPKKNTVTILSQANSLCKKGEHRELIRFLDKKLAHLKSQEQKSQAFFILAKSYYQQHEYAKAILKAHQSLEFYPDNDQSWYYLGLCYWKVKNMEQSLECYQKAIALDSSHYAYHLNCAMVLRDLDRHAQATSYYETLLGMDPRAVHYMRNKVATIHYTSTSHPDFDYLTKVIDNPLSHADDKMQAYYGLSKIYIDCKMYDKAQTCAQLGNQLRSKIFPFNQTVMDDHFHAIKSAFTKSLISKGQEQGHLSARPVFIFGLSRSGKSLLENLLSQNSLVYPKHECCFLGTMILDFMKQFKINQFYNQGLQKLLDGRLENFAKKFYGLLCYGVSPDIQWIIDTTPQNSENLGLLKMMFPNAKFIFCQRNPLDNYVKVFFKYYASGNSYANQMQDIAFYDQQIQSLMTFWKEACELEYMTVHYEDLIQQPEKILPKVCAYLEMPPMSFDLSQIHPEEIGFAEHFKELCQMVVPDVSRKFGL